MTYEYEYVDGWIIRDHAGYRPDDEVSKATVFALANGYMSSRGAPEFISPLVPGVVGHHVNGLYDSPSGGILDREMINLPAWTPLQLTLNGHVLGLDDDTLQGYTRELDLRRGLLRQTCRWMTPDGISVTVEGERLVSMARGHLGAIRWRIMADADCTLRIASGLDAAVNNRFAESHFAQIDIDAINHAIAITTPQESYRAVVMAVDACDQPGAWASEQTPQQVWRARTLPLAANQPATLTKFAAVYDSRFSDGDLAAHCRAELDEAQAMGYQAVRAAHEAAWAERWAASDVVIDGDREAQIAIRFCLFHLLANAPHSDRVSISARGLQGQDYWGSIFWDCDIYVLPFFTTTQPEVARRCLRYRHHTLDGARRKARGLGYAGAYYAWQSQESGDETCALYVFDDPHTGEKIRSYFADEQIHISADVVYALWQYVQASGDERFLAAYGLEIACAVARFFASRVTHNAQADRYELRTVLGPDEYHERVHNNAYTNALARLSLEVTLAALARVRRAHATTYERVTARLNLTADEIMRWRTVADKLYVPQPDPDSGLIEQFDGYFALEDAPPEEVRARLTHPDQYPGGLTGPYQATQAIKQADVALLLYLLRDRYNAAVKRANWQYYEPRTAHDSSLSPMAYALVAADIGLTDWAYRYFMHTAMMDLLGTGPHWNLGVHTAALGGAWLAVAHGFCQLDLRDDGLHLRAWPRLPQQWTRVRLRVNWHGHPITITVAPEQVSLRAESGPVPVQHPGGQATLQPDTPINLPYALATKDIS